MMEPIDYRGALTRGWRLIVVLGLIGLVIGLLATPSGVTQWKATSQVGALPADTLSAGGSNSPLATGVPTDQIIFYASSDLVQIPAGKLAGIDVNPAVLRDRIAFSGPTTNSNTGEAVGQIGVVSVFTTGPTEAQAVDLNRAFVTELGSTVNKEATDQLKSQQTQVFNSILSVQKQLDGVADQAGVTATAYEAELTALETRQAQLATETPYTGFTVLELASNATETKASLVDSRPVRGLAGLLIGIILGAVIAIVVSVLDKRLRSASRAGEVFGYPVVAEIPDHSVPSAEKYRMLALAVLEEPLSHRSRERGAEPDDYELVYDRLDLAPSGAVAGQVATPPTAGLAAVATLPQRRQVVLVASPGSEPTKAVVGASLARSFAESGRRVVVISTGAVPTNGEATYAPPATVDPTEVAALLEDTSVPGVSVLPMENLAAHSSQLLSVVPSVIDALRDLVDLVIIDVPPLLTVHHGEGLVPMVDVVVIVAEYRFSTADELRQAGSVLERLSAPVSGLVFTNVPTRSHGDADPGAPDDSEQVLTGDAEVVDPLVSVSAPSDAVPTDATTAPSAAPEEPRHDGDVDPRS